MANGLANVIRDLPEPLMVLITLAVCAAAIAMAVRGFLLRRREERRRAREDRPVRTRRDESER